MPRVKLADYHMLGRMIYRDWLGRLSNICGARALEEDLPGKKKATALFTIAFRALSLASNSTSRSGDNKKKFTDNEHSKLRQGTYSLAFW
jgi:hypothetical protein